MFPPPPSHPAYNVASVRAERAAEKDLSFRLWMQELAKKSPSFALTRTEGGTKFPMANLLRHYFREYASRIVNHGFQSLPSSFNVVESFLRFSHDYFMFDLRQEKEHLLRLYDYLDWYTAGPIPEEPEILIEVAKEGVIYSYNMVEPAGDFRVQTADSELVVCGAALIRHSTELSMIVLCGESPPDLSDEEAADFDRGHPIVGKERLEISPEYSAKDRYLKEVPGYSRVIGLVRLDLRTRKCFVRYLNHDVGPGYRVATDDPTIFTKDVAESQREKILAASSETLDRYEPLFASLWSLMYLPVLFIDRHDQVAETTFSTELHARRTSTEVRKAVRLLGRKSVRFSRTVFCLQSTECESVEDERIVVPPFLEHSNSGFWKSLPPGEIGEDEDGNAIVGKTWVERTEIWSNRRVEDFVVRKHGKPLEGANPGDVYVMRSGSHGLDLYKIGKTRRSPGVRASELSGATGVPTPFEVLASWQVGDVDLVERKAHERLRAYRVHRRREFFRAPLPTIISEINAIVEESAS